MHEKKWYKSKGVVGSLLTMITGILVSFGAIEQISQSEIDSVGDNIIGLIVAAEGLIAFIGRVFAKSKIKGPGKAAGVLLLIIVLTGCGKVQMSPDYARRLEISAVNAAELNRRCQAGDDEACKQGLQITSETLNLLVDGLHGRGPDDVK